MLFSFCEYNVKLMESDSKKEFWALKPYWCQPWSIISFGILIILTTWSIFNNIIITSIIGLIIIMWWILFLIIVPGSNE